MHDKTSKPHKNHVYLLTEVVDTALLKRPAPQMVVSAPSRAKAREAASLEDPFRPAVWLDADRSRCELAPTRRTAVLCKNFDTGEG